MRARAAYREEMRGKMEAGPRTGNQRVVVGAVAMRAMYVVGMGKGRPRFVDLKALIRNILPQRRVFHYRFLHGDNVELLVHEDDYAEIARVLTSFLLKIKGEYSPVCGMTTKPPGETYNQRGERNARFTYKAIVRFPLEMRTPEAVRKYYFRIMRKLESEFPVVCNPAGLRKERDWDRRRRERDLHAEARKEGVGEEREVNEGGGKEAQDGDESEGESTSDVSMASGLQRDGEGESRETASSASSETGSYNSWSESEDGKDLEEADRRRMKRKNAPYERGGETERENMQRDAVHAIE